MPLPPALNIAEFAEYKEVINRLYLIDDDFRALCDDFSMSKTHLEKFNAHSLEDKQRKIEYQQLTLELEKEILDYVNKLTYGPDRH